MQVERLNLETSTKEMVESVGVVRYIGYDKNAPDLSNGSLYYVIGFRNNLMKLIDDSMDYYYYLPFDAKDINEQEGIKAGFEIVEDETGQIAQVFNSYQKERAVQLEKNSKKLVNRLIDWKFKRLEKKEKGSK